MKYGELNSVVFLLIRGSLYIGVGESLLVLLIFSILAAYSHGQDFFLGGILISTVILTIIAAWIRLCTKKRGILPIALGYTFAPDDFTYLIKQQTISTTRANKTDIIDKLSNRLSKAGSVLASNLAALIPALSFLSACYFAIVSGLFAYWLFFSKSSGNIEKTAYFIAFLEESVTCLLWTVVPVFFATSLEQLRLWFNLIGHRTWSLEARRYALDPAARLALFTSLVGLIPATPIVTGFNSIVSTYFSLPNWISILITLSFAYPVLLIISCLLLVWLPYQLGLHRSSAIKVVGGIISGILTTLALQPLLAILKEWAPKIFH
jgi:hypothetical protein